jgi:hypothetical protein
VLTLTRRGQRAYAEIETVRHVVEQTLIGVLSLPTEASF